MNNKAWSQLPNAHHIDRILESLKAHPNIWTDTWGSTYDATWDVAWSVVRSASREEAWDPAFYAAWDASGGAHRNAAEDAILALIAWDDCDIYLNMTYEELKVYAILSKRPQAILLLPAVRAFEQIKALETV